MINVECAYCGAPMRVGNDRLTRTKNGLLYCSRACRWAHGATDGGPPRELPDLTCPICGATFYRIRAERRATNYCSYSCAAKGTRNLKPPAKGSRRNVATEFKPGTIPANRLPVGSVTVRHRVGRQDGPRAWVKIADPNVWRPRAVVEWEKAHGPLKRGQVVHHKNRDTLDDSLGNLEAIDRAKHLHEHRPEFEGKRKTNAARARRR